MPKPVIIPVPVEELEWKLVREGIQRCIQAGAPTARVYARWPLKYDIGQTAELLKSDADNGNLHAWIIAVSSAKPSTDRAGNNNCMLWDLTLRIWGFIGYEYGIDSDNPQNDMENECRKVAQIIRANNVDLTLDTSSCLKEVGDIEFPDIDTQAFGQDNIIVAQGEMKIKLKESL